jgi:hypothetical protein
MSDPLPATVGTGDQFATFVLLNVLGNADEAGSFAGSTGSRKASQSSPAREAGNSESPFRGQSQGLGSRSRGKRGPPMEMVCW